MLNDHCLLEIFKYLSVVDLANFKENFDVLGAVADMEFSKKTSGSFFFGSRDRMDKALQIIRQFGSAIKDLTINYHGWYETDWRNIFSTINEHCSDELKALALCGDAVGRINESDIWFIADVLKNVETLELKNLNCEVRPMFSHDFVNILRHCENVRSIELTSYIDMEVHASLFRVNKKLSKLKLLGLSDLKTIIDGLLDATRLEELTVSSVTDAVESFADNVSHLCRLNHLKRLSIDCCYMDITPFLRTLNAANALNILSLSNAELDIATLAQLTRLKVLKLRHCCLTTKLLFDSVLDLCGNKNFEHLILLCYHEPIDEMNFLKLVEKRKASMAEQPLCLTLKNCFYVQTLKAIPSELLVANEETIRLIDEDDPNYEYYALDRNENEF